MDYGNNWHPWRRFNGQSNLAPSLANITDRLAEVHVGQDNKIYKRVLGASPGKRGYYSEMRWNNPQGGFGVNSTYENKVVLGNGSTSGYSTYLSKDTTSWPQCFPVLNYWASNLPYSYLDTRVLNPVEHGISCDNSSEEVTYTIGSSNPRMLNAGTTYFNYMLTSKGTRANPIFTLRTQKGELRPADCYNYLMCRTIFDRDYCLSQAATDSTLNCNPNRWDSNGRYKCPSTDNFNNTNNVDVWCSFMDTCTPEQCAGDFLVKYDSTDPRIPATRYMDRSSTAPYWFIQVNR
jgi:hypothetical protein